jgi:DNA-binding FadR family transcriptional regulator
MASGNMAYPMFLNSFKPVYTHLAEFFFRDARVVPWVISGHEDLVNAIGRRDKSEAGAVMRRLLDHGETHLRSILPREGGPS